MRPVRCITSNCLQCALALVVLTLAAGCAVDDPVEPPPDDSRWLLLELYDRMGGTGWTNSENWATDAPLDSWHGVTTDDKGNVVGLNLRGNGLTGRIPWRIHALVHLESLDLRNNTLDGRIPPELGYLTNLVTLRLGSNDLDGPIPSELGYLSNSRHAGSPAEPTGRPDPLGTRRPQEPRTPRAVFQLVDRPDPLGTRLRHEPPVSLA